MKRLFNASINVLRGAATPIYSVLLSLVVIQKSEAAIWGSFVQLLILIGLLAQLLNWGYRDHLLRRFAKAPKDMGQLFLNNLITRSFGLPFAITVLWIYSSSPLETLFLSGWLVLAFLYFSLEVLVVYQRYFAQQFIADTIGFLVVLTGLVLIETEGFTLNNLLQWFLAGMAVKLLLLAFFLRKEWLVLELPQLELSFFKASLPFFLIGFNGMLLSKADLYITSFYVLPAALGKYQVCMNFFIYLQALSGLASVPFLKLMFRITENSYFKLSRSFRIFGLFACLVFTPLIQFIITNVYGFDLPWQFFILGGCIAFPVFFYTPNIIFLYRIHFEKKVMWVNLAAAFLSGGITLVLINKHGIIAGFIAAAIAQWALLFFYHFNAKTIDKNELLSESSTLHAEQISRPNG
jgi:O-antigen/teichoic acid export membrane protein